MKEFGSILEVIGGLKEEICNVQVDVELNFIILKLEKFFIENEVEELILELMVVNEYLEKVNVVKMNVEIEFVKSIIKEIIVVSVLCIDFDVFCFKFIIIRGREIKLEKMSLEVVKLRLWMILSMEIMVILFVLEVSVKMDILYVELCVIKEFEVYYYENVKNL